jgi:hypothetical protein
MNKLRTFSKAQFWQKKFQFLGGVVFSLIGKKKQPVFPAVFFKVFT